MQIIAETPHEAFNIAHRKAGENVTVIWDGKRKLVRVRNKGTGANPIWVIE